MLTPTNLDNVPDELVELYTTLEIEILEDIARRIKKMEKLTPSADLQTKILLESGQLYEEIMLKIAKMTGFSEKEVKKIYEKSTTKALSTDFLVYKEAGKSVIPLTKNKTLLLFLAESVKKSNQEFVNLTNSMAVAGQQLFTREASNAVVRTMSGMPASTSIKDAIDNVGREQLKILYQNTTRSVESAVRTNVLTGINQTTAKIQDEYMDSAGIDKVQTSAHSGARSGEGYKGHVNWQGKIFKRTELAQKTGLGKVDGLRGANCKHVYFAYIDGISENMYSKGQLKDYSKPTIKYKGKMITEYEATQKLRYYQRGVRHWKKINATQVAGGYDGFKSNMKIKEWQRKAREYTKATGIRRDYDFERVAK